MRLSYILFASSFVANSAVNAIAIPGSELIAHIRFPIPFAERDVDPQELWKRKGGGGRGSSGSSGGSSSSGGSRSGGSSSSSSSSSSSGKSGSSSSSSSSGSGSRSGSSSSGGSSGRTSSSSNLGGSTRAGSGPPPAYGRGVYYGGGSKTPYAAGSPSPVGKIVPFALLGVGAYAFWPGVWYHPPYFYPYYHPYGYYNRSSNRNESRPVLCACQQYESCGCDDDNNSTFLNDIIGNGSYDALNKTLVNVAVVNGTNTILLNGTLPNGTTAPGGEDDEEDTSDAVAVVLRAAGFWPVVATVAATIFLL